MQCQTCIKYYSSKKDKVLEKKKTYYDNHKEYYSEQNKKRKSKISDLENQIKTLTELVKTTVSVS